MMSHSMKCVKKAKIKIKFQKMKGTFLDSIPWLKSHQPPMIYTVLELSYLNPIRFTDRKKL